MRIGCWLGLLLPSVAAAQIFPEIIARTGAGVQVDQVAARGRMSPDARYVAFATVSGALDATDTNGLIDVYVKDRQTGTIDRISKGPGGVLATGGHSGWDGFGFDTHGLAISDDGSRVAFLSSATNLVANDLNSRRDAFLWERASNTVTLLSKSAGGVQGDGDCTHIAISGDGSVVAFSSFATNLVASDTNSTIDLFGYVVGAGTIERVSLTDADTEMPMAPSADRGALEPSLSRDGRYVAFTAEPALGITDCAGQAAETWVRDRVAQTTVQASRFTGEPGTSCGGTANPRISADGRYVVWYSSARMALPDVAGGTLDVFLRDMQLGITEHISQSTEGLVGHIGCGWPWVSEDGRFVSFNCNGIFGPDDLLNGNDAYVRDRTLRQTLRFSVSSAQAHPNSVSELASISPSGKWLLFESQATNLVPGDASGHRDVLLAPNPFLFDPPSRLGGGGTDPSQNGVLSDDGRYVFFETIEALDVTDNNGTSDVYRRDLVSGAVVRVTVADNEAQIGSGGGDYAVSADGERVVFIALDNGSIGTKGGHPDTKLALTPTAFVRSLITGTTQRMGPAAVPSKQPTISKDGTTVAFVTNANGVVVGDTNGMDDVYVADADTGAVEARASAPVSGDADGASQNPVLSADGNVIVFETLANNLITTGTADNNGFSDIVRANLSLAQRARVSVTPTQQGNGPSTNPSVSADGNVVVFASEADNLGGTDGNDFSDVFVSDLNTAGGVPQLASVGAAGAGNGASTLPTVSSDGTTIAFSSDADDLTSSDSNNASDVFIADRATLFRRRVARSDGGTQANGNSLRPRLSRDGQRVAFHSFASNLSLSDTNGTQSDVYLNGPLDPLRIFRSRFE